MSIHIPMSKVAAKPEPDLAEKTGAPALKVLLLDDEDEFRDTVRDFLVTRFFQVTEARNGVEGLKAVMQDTFDLIVCDMLMPNLGGEMFYWAVTRVRPAARLRFLFITGHQNDPTVAHFFRRIKATVLYKPFKLENLNACLLEVDRKLR